jgi:phage baseplate assembly protein W
LQKQQISFTEQKASELQAQQEKIIVRYEDRIKIDREELQREYKEKMTRVNEQKEQTEAKYNAKR